MSHLSSTRAVPAVSRVPRHLAIIMDGNGRWATKRFLPRVAGHKKGVDAVRTIVEACVVRGVEYLTLFAFSSENWRRPPDEVTFLMRLFILALEREVKRMHENNIRFRVIGDLTAFDAEIQKLVQEAQARTALNTGLTVTVAANYGGRWDMLQATQKLLAQQLSPEQVTEERFAAELAMAYAPEPDLFIRTGGEQRVSNFLLWQLAYTELYFTDVYWPDFDEKALDAAIYSYQQRERRFGQTSAQVAQVPQPDK